MNETSRAVTAPSIRALTAPSIVVALGLLSALALGGCTRDAGEGPRVAAESWTHDAQIDPREQRFLHLRQLTFGGENAEAYFSFRGDRLVFQAKHEGMGCDQIFVMDLAGGNPRRVSNGLGVTTCSYFLPGDERVLFASTHGASPDCPPPPDRSQGYVWPVHPGYDVWTVGLDGQDLRPLVQADGYDAEATVSPKGDRIVFTSARDGDLELYSIAIDGSDLRRLTHDVGYDGGAFFSHDGKKIVYRADHPQEDERVADYRRLLENGLVRPTRMELWVMDADGGNKRQITRNGKANFCPYFTPDDRRILFSSNLGDEKGREFDLYSIGIDGEGLERVTYHEQFDGFPMFSPDGRYLVFASNRGAAKPGDTNVFLAEWKP